MVEVGAHVPQRVPGPVGEIGRTEVLRIGREVDAAHAECRHPLRLAHASVDVPGRQHRHGEQPVPRLLLEFGHGVVVDLDAQETQPLVRHRAGQALTPEPDGVGEHHLGPDPGIVHDLETGFGVVSGHVDPVEGPFEERLRGPTLAPVAGDDPSATGEPELVVVHDPGRPSVGTLLHLRHPILVGGGRPLGPQVVRFGEVGVGIDHPQSLKCQRHRVFPQ
jgi:hypothetical protein